MKIIVCLDDNNGMTFNCRRQTKDREVRRDMLFLVRDQELWLNTYSWKQFDPNKIYPQIHVDENFPAHAPENAYCFLESSDYLINKYNVTEVVIYRWNRRYPADTYFEFDFTGWKKESEKQFAGFSHEKITREVWKHEQ